MMKVVVAIDDTAVERFLGFGVLLAGILEGISKDWKMGPHPTSSAC